MNAYSKVDEVIVVRLINPKIVSFILTLIKDKCIFQFINTILYILKCN